MGAFSTIDGEFIQVLVNGTVIANGTDCKYSFQSDTRETTTKDGGSWKQLEYTKRSGSVSGGFLQTTQAYSTANLFTVLNNRTKVSLRFGGTTSGDTFFTATAVLTKLDISAPQKDNITGSYSFELDGAPVATVI